MTESCRLIPTEQYQEYLKLKEEHKPLSWEELTEAAKKMGAEIFVYCGGDSILFKGVEFYDVGTIEVLYDHYDKENGVTYQDSATLSTNRTPDQMLAIMKALQ